MALRRLVIKVELNESGGQSLQLSGSSDKGDPTDVHPRQKQDIGSRLARIALHDSYDMDSIIPTGPMYSGYEVTKDGVYLSFGYGIGMKSSDGGAIVGFEVADFDKQYIEVDVEVVDDKIFIKSDYPEQIKFIRYSWKPVSNANLVNSENLPASTFLESIK